MSKKWIGMVFAFMLMVTIPLSAATILYYNFEDGTPGVAMNGTGTNGQIGSLDISGNNRHMYAWNTIAGPWFSALHDTPTGIGLSSKHNAQDGYCFEPVLVAWSPSVWTIELSFKLDTIAGWRTLIGRDGFPIWSGGQVDIGAALYIQKNDRNRAITLDFATVSGERYTMDTSLFPVAGQWYHLAIVAAGDTINIYADRLDGNEFQNVGTFNMTPGQDHALLATGTWTFGRGWFNGNQADAIMGNLDDIRFSDVALTPAQFIHSQYAYNPSPAVNAPNVPTSVNTLSWTNRNNVDVCEVYFGKNIPEPNSLDYKTKLTMIGSVDNPEKTSSISIPGTLALAEGDVCYWVVDSYRNSAVPPEPNDLPGLMWTFKVNNNDVPVVNAGADQGVWLGMNGTPGEATVSLNGTVMDDGLPNPPGKLTLAWTQVAGPTVTVSPADAAVASVTFTEVGTYEFKLSATDGEFSAEDNVMIYVGEFACQASHMMPGAPAYSTYDFNLDCRVDLVDFADFAAGWLDCSDILSNCN
ncbi:MAG: LamG domain-containing protein [Phycisphaerae bacterium]|nr:LamG domain-containing protein [Phycisphaerae bacterium]